MAIGPKTLSYLQKRHKNLKKDTPKLTESPVRDTKLR